MLVRATRQYFYEIVSPAAPDVAAANAGFSPFVIQVILVDLVHGIVVFDGQEPLARWVLHVNGLGLQNTLYMTRWPSDLECHTVSIRAAFCLMNRR